jgi:hypothetical protein
LWLSKGLLVEKKSAPQYAENNNRYFIAL